MQVGLNFRQSSLNFMQVGLNFQQVRLNFQTFGKIFVSICDIKCPKFGRASFAISIPHEYPTQANEWSGGLEV